MELRKLVEFLVLMTLFLIVGKVAAVQVHSSGCQNQTQPMPFTNGAGEITIVSNNCSDSVGKEKTTVEADLPVRKRLNTTKTSLSTDNPEVHSDSRVVDGSNAGLSGTTVDQLGDSVDIDDSLEVDDDDGSEGGGLQPAGPQQEVDPGDSAIGEGNLLCPANWVCSMKGNNRTLSKPSGVVMKAIPYIGLSSLAVMVVMAVAAALWMNRNKAGNGQIFGMKQLHRRSDNLEGCSSIAGDSNTVTVNMLALNNNPKDPGIAITLRDSRFHEYSLPDVVTNEGIDNRMNRTVQGESLYMELSDLQSRTGDEDDQGSTSMLIHTKRAPKGGDRKSHHIYYRPVPVLPDIQQDIEEDLPNVEQLPDPILPNPLATIPVPNELPQATDYYPIHIPGFQMPQATIPELDLYSDMPPHCSVYEVNDTSKRRSLMPPMDGMSSTTTSVAGGSIYTLQGPILEGDMIRDIDAEALYEQIEDRDRRSWATTSSDTSSSSCSNATSDHSTFAPLLSLVPSRESLGMGPVMFTNVAAHQRENYDKIDRTKRAYNKPRETECHEEDYNTLVMWP